MKSYVFVIFLSLSFIWSCGSGNGNEGSQVVDNEIVVKEKPDKVEKPEVKINEKFSAFLSKFTKTSLPYSINPNGNEEYKKIPMNEQVSYLSKAEGLSKADLEDMKDYTDFYYVSNPINTDKYHAIIYGRFEQGSVYYFLCTYNNDGKLISHVDFAAYEMMSVGPQSGHEYYSKGLINDKHEVEVKTEEETEKYTINENGEIVKM